MRKFIQNKLKDQKGLTLIELLAVIVILAIIAAIAIPAIGNIIENSRYSAVKSDATNILNSANVYFTENPTDTDATLTEITDGGYLQSAGKFETVAAANVIISKANPMKLTAPAITFSGSKTIKFTNATLDQITKDSTKGSAITTSATINTSGATVVAP